MTAHHLDVELESSIRIDTSKLTSVLSSYQFPKAEIDLAADLNKAA